MWDEVLSSLSSRQDTASPTDTACSSESPAFLGASSSHLLLYDQNSSEEELEVINGGAGVVGSCDIDVGSVCGVPSRIGGDGNGGGCGVIIGGIGVAVINPHAAGVDEDDDEDDRTEEIVEEDDDEGEQEEDEEEDEEEEEEENYRGPPVTATTPTVMATATTIIGSAIGAMDTSSSNSSGVRGQFVPLGGAVSDRVEGLFGRSESVDDFSDELSGLTATVSGLPAAKVTSASGKRFASVSKALKPHRGHIIQRSTTPLVLSEGSGTGVAPGAGLLLSAGSGNSGFYGTGGSNGVGGGAGSLRFGLGRRPIGCDSPLTAAVSHRNGTNQQPQPVGGCSGAGSGLSTTTSARTSSSSTSSLSSSSSLVRLGGGTCSPSLDPCGVLEHHGSLVTNMDVSRSVSPPAKMFHCAVSPRRRQSRHQQHQRLQRPHRPCLDFDKMQQLKARSVTTWRHSNEHSGELSVFCW
uniref:Uncharacterized protein n=1 Tax=Anopheles atroparvus TaxID=41427 RepID=A0A182JJZ7_ANOAO